ncbi:dioxygenase family protein [Nocardia cyriacigeorgica]|uniref:dioxygenase family protein n=1 Tax=Nocardia cyriacigeorgica TaxID=135487 RepID=UPI001E56438D|nr:dioxygenase [Nocardia cyriacigeorgica]
MSRRRALWMFGAAGAAGAAAVAAGCASDSGTEAASPSTTTASAGALAAAPAETAGPYPGDGSNGPNVLIESGVVRSDVTGSFGAYSGVADGVPLTIDLTLHDLSEGSLGAGMALYLWQCDRQGRYSLYSDGVTEQNYLRGVQVADAAGKVTFTSIFPACYDGRWPHLHFEVYDSLESAVAGDNARLTSQIALPEDSCEAVYAHDSGYSASIPNLSAVSLDSDMVFGDGWDAELATVTGSPATGLTATLTIGVAEKSAGTSPDGRGPGGMPPGASNGRPPGPPPGGTGPQPGN